jgi:hypothetical protein
MSSLSFWLQICASVSWYRFPLRRAQEQPLLVSESKEGATDLAGESAGQRLASGGDADRLSQR